MAGETLPIIDFSPVANGRPDGLARVADAIHTACTTMGFFYIVNHGVPQGVITEAETVMRRFFDLPVKEKHHGIS